MAKPHDKLAFDTSFFLELSRRGSQRTSYLPSLVSAAAKADFQLWTVAAIAQECIGHLVHVKPALPAEAFHASPEARFARAFFGVVHLWPVSGLDVLAAGLAVRGLAGADPTGSRRRIPSLADALLVRTAARDPDLRIIVTDDPGDVIALAPDHHVRRVYSVGEMIRTLGG